jgi:cytochrome c oxidase subunit IV
MADTHVAAAHTHKAPNYMLIWLYLFVLTCVEVGVAFFSHMPKAILIVALLFLAIWKALLVAAYYMHLKFEPRTLWFIVGVPIPLILILLSAVLMEHLGK